MHLGVIRLCGNRAPLEGPGVLGCNGVIAGVVTGLSEGEPVCCCCFWRRVLGSGRGQTAEGPERETQCPALRVPSHDPVFGEG